MPAGGTAAVLRATGHCTVGASTKAAPSRLGHWNTRTESYRDLEARLDTLRRASSIPEAEQGANVALWITPQHLRRMLFLYEMYKEAIPVPGVMMLFGTLWGRTAALFDGLRTAFEPFNQSRKLVCFDTFEGYRGVQAQDGTASVIQEGNIATTTGYEQELEEILSVREKLSPVSQVKKFELVKGDVEQTLPAYLEKHPHTIVSLAHIDVNLYGPTKSCLERIMDHVVKGSIIIIDEVNCEQFPGETVALKEVLGLKNIRLKRHPTINPTWPAYFVVE